ncbi:MULTISPECIES: beta-glucosidase [Rathayibacter]|nr:MULTISPECIES: glycoside hydrolase family 3 C-terminal domain-containing protein [Rathayibacter]
MTSTSSESRTTGADDVFVSDLTLNEKVSLVVGASGSETVAIERLNVRSVRLVDGPHGVRRHVDGASLGMFDSLPATCFPTAVTLGSSWNTALMQEVGVALGLEAAAAEIDVLLGPGANLKRTPLGGRNFEYFSEDPALSSGMASAWIRGVQSTGVGASLKHFAANNAEQRRYGIDVYVDERALRELYLASFERSVIDEKPRTIMAAYSKLNGIHCTENTWLLKDLLRAEWGYHGLIVSDWGAAWDGVAALRGGTDLTMPGPLPARGILTALERGEIAITHLDEAAGRVLDLAKRPAPMSSVIDHESHHRLARRAAAEGTVLLKNDGGMLPLAAGKTIALIGAFAKTPRYQGAGSSNVVPTRLDDLADVLSCAVGAKDVTYSPGYDRTESTTTPSMLADAANAASMANIALVVIGLPEVLESEGVDRRHMQLPPAHNELVAAVMAANPQTVVVLMNGSPVEMPWRDEVPAILEAYLGGQAGGSALADVLLGVSEPGGRLAESFPARYSDHPVSSLPAGPKQTEYREGIFLGYRYFDTAQVEVAFPFGHGLSYTTFQWGEATLLQSGSVDSADLSVTLTMTIKNVGVRSGSEVVQIYVSDPKASVYRPAQELRAFEKVHLAPDEDSIVTFQLDNRAFAYWDVETQGWVVEPGQFYVHVGASSRDIRQTVEIKIASFSPHAQTSKAPNPYEHVNPDAFTRAGFEALLGRRLPSNEAPQAGRFGLDTALGDMQGTLVGRVLFRLMRRLVARELGVPKGDPLIAIASDVVKQINFRMFPTLSGGTVTPARARVLLWVVNRCSRSFLGRRGGEVRRPD